MTIRISFGVYGETARWALRVVDQVSKKDVVRPLLLDARPNAVHNENLVLAGLCLAGDVDDDFFFTGHLGDGFVSYLKDNLGVEIRSKLTKEQKQIYTQATTLELIEGYNLYPKTPDRDCTRLFLVPSSRFSGSLVGVKERVIASNSWFLRSELGGRVCAAAALLFAADMLAADLVLPISETDLGNLTPLVNAAGLGLSRSE